MNKRRKIPESQRKSTIGFNPLDRLDQIPGKGKKKARFKEATPQSEIREFILKKRRPPKEGMITKWVKSVLGQFR